MPITFDSGQHADLVRALGRAADDIQAELDALDAAVRTTRSQWTGAAQTAYERAHRDWVSRMASLRAMLQAAVASGAHAGARLEHADEEAASVWR